MNYMFAIIDIETCGGKFEFRKGRITEICILKHDGLSVIERFTTLINPECNISSYFTGLTGITNDMVADAPRFHEIAPKILEMTEGCIFVAHNVGFDYGFIKEEFNSLGYKYKRETLCTVRLSRKLMPGRISYSLGHLCASLGIEIFGRHRAQGDAEATAILFDLLIQLKGQHPQYKNMGVEEIMVRRIDKIKQYILNKLPEECGVYYFFNKTGEIIYVGKSTNIYSRAQSHFNTDTQKGKKMLNDLYNVDYVATGSELIALLLESEEIKKHKPRYNRMRKSEEFTHCIDYFTDKKGILNFKIVPFEESESPLLTFTSYGSARDRLEILLDKYELCLKHCGLTSEESICFNHQIKKCKGICADFEEVEIYNTRAQILLDEYLFKLKNFVILDKGRTATEHSVVLVENAHYKGYGYYDSFEQISNPEEFKGFIKNVRYYPDADDLIRQFLNKGKKAIINLETPMNNESYEFD
ncbi:exonuclease domain-containing protein [Aurantibacillus circumpalustris]|uniref:exonuclease domain-containing protein n=1 Tax=Aurantibacillus circumpalustris TaxID=3036359 RepID=UPI00295B000F|nr:exonuclease domain-containing protein [Aurantibacillus circumpalustris]